MNIIESIKSEVNSNRLLEFITTTDIKIKSIFETSKGTQEYTLNYPRGSILHVGLSESNTVVIPKVSQMKDSNKVKFVPIVVEMSRHTFEKVINESKGLRVKSDYKPVIKFIESINLFKLMRDRLSESDFNRTSFIKSLIENRKVIIKDGKCYIKSPVMVAETSSIPSLNKLNKVKVSTSLRGKVLEMEVGDTPQDQMILNEPGVIDTIDLSTDTDKFTEILMKMTASVNDKSYNFKVIKNTDNTISIKCYYNDEYLGEFKFNDEGYEHINSGNSIKFDNLVTQMELCMNNIVDHNLICAPVGLDSTALTIESEIPYTAMKTLLDRGLGVKELVDTEVIDGVEYNELYQIDKLNTIWSFPNWEVYCALSPDKEYHVIIRSTDESQYININFGGKFSSMVDFLSLELIKLKHYADIAMLYNELVTDNDFIITNKVLPTDINLVITESEKDGEMEYNDLPDIDTDAHDYNITMSDEDQIVHEELLRKVNKFLESDTPYKGEVDPTNMGEYSDALNKLNHIRAQYELDPIEYPHFPEQQLEEAAELEFDHDLMTVDQVISQYGMTQEDAENYVGAIHHIGSYGGETDEQNNPEYVQSLMTVARIRDNYKIDPIKWDNNYDEVPGLTTEDIDGYEGKGDLYDKIERDEEEVGVDLDDDGEEGESTEHRGKVYHHFK